MSELDAAKESGKSRIKESYEKHIEVATVTVNGTQYDITGGVETITAFTIAENAAKYRNQSTVKIRDSSNIVHTIILSDFSTLISELCCYGNDAWGKKVYLQMQIDQCTTDDQVINIVW